MKPRLPYIASISNDLGTMPMLSFKDQNVSTVERGECVQSYPPVFMPDPFNKICWILYIGRLSIEHKLINVWIFSVFVISIFRRKLRASSGLYYFITFYLRYISYMNYTWNPTHPHNYIHLLWNPLRMCRRTIHWYWCNRRPRDRGCTHTHSNLHNCQLMLSGNNRTYIGTRTNLELRIKMKLYCKESWNWIDKSWKKISMISKNYKNLKVAKNNFRIKR